MVTGYTFERLSKQGSEVPNDEKIGLTGILTGAIIESFGPPGIQMSLMPESEPFDVNPESRVLLFLPGNFDSAYLRQLAFAKEVGSRVCVEGTYEHKPNGNYLGNITAESFGEKP